jgi:putative ABC transport system permease protein
VDRGQVDASWREVGADYRLETITGAGVSPRVDPGAVPGVHAVARGMVDSLAPFASTANQRSTIYLHAIEPAAYAEVTADGPLRPAWPAAFLQPPVSAGLGTPENPIPAIVSRRLPVGSVTLNPGALFELTVRGQAMTLRVAEVRNTHPGIPVGIAFVVAPFDQLATAYANPPLLPSALFMAGPAEIEEQLVATLREQSVSVLITSRHTRYAALQDAPLVAAIAIGFRLALLAAAGYTALAVIVALTLSAARRTRDLAFLKTLGLSARQSLGLTVVEHGPPVLLALIPGVALGIGVAFLLGPGLGLSSFVGSEVAVTLRVDWPALAAVSIGLVLVVTLAIAFSTWISRRARAVDALRIGDD